MKLSIVGGRETERGSCRDTSVRSAMNGGLQPRRSGMSKRDRDLLTIVFCCAALAILLAQALFF